MENLKQGASEEVGDFLIRVTNAVDDLGKECKELLTKEELKTLQYKVFLNGVNKEIQHVLDSKAVKHGQMTPTQIYTAVRRFETYMAHNERLDGKGFTLAQPRAQASEAPCYKPQFHKTTAFKTADVEPTGPPFRGSDSESIGGSESGESRDTTEGPGRLFLPDFLGEASDNDWGLHVRLARAMQAEEQCQRYCFLCQSPDHLMRDCPTAKNGQRPLKSRGPAKNNSASVAANVKAKIKNQTQFTASTHVVCTPTGSAHIKSQEVPYLNPNPFCRLIGPKNWD